MDVGLVEDDYLARLQARTQRQCSLVVMVVGFLDNGKLWEKGLQVKPQMHFCGCLAATVLGPVHTVGNQSNRSGVECVNGSLKAAGQALVATRRAELRIERLEMSKDSPKQFLYHVTVTVFVRMRERVAAWRHRAANGYKFCPMVAKAITDIV